jgi:YVTN family beta-propeller protein
MVELPSGAVTFLFTDIEGSTRLVKQLRDRWDAVLADHRRLLREVFAAHRGYEVDTQGDSFFVVFARPRDAVLAAVEGQLRLSSHPWPEGVDLKVRMGIHTGQAAVSDSRYTGLAVHRAARIGAAAHGGQVLVSQATQTLLEDEEEDLHVFLRDLGEQRLKDLDRPVRLYQLAAEGLATQFPPLKVVPRASRRRFAIAAAAILGTAAAASVAVLLLTGSASGTSIRPNSVGLLDPRSNRIVAQVPVGVRPGAVAVGRDGVWVANAADRTVSRIDPGTRSVRHTISLGGTPTGLAVGSGAVWVAHGVSGSISRIDPSFDVVKHLPVTHAFEGGGLAGTVASGGGKVWTAWGNSVIARLDPSTGRVLGTSFAGRSPSAIAYGADAFWVTNAGDNTLSRFSAITGRPSRAAIPVGAGPQGVAVGGGAVWVAASADNTVTRIDIGSGSAATISVGARPEGVAYGDDAVWVANADDGTVTRIDPATDSVRTIKVGGAPAGIAVGAGGVWITVQAR